MLIDLFFTSFAGTPHRTFLAPSTWAGRAPRNGLCDPNFMFLGDMLVFWKSSFEHLNSSQVFWVNGIGVEQLNSRATMYSCHLLSPPQWIQFERAEGFLHLVQTCYYRRHLLWRWCHWERYCPMRSSGQLTHIAHMARGSHQNQCYLFFVLLSEALTSECTMDLLMRIRCLGWNDTWLLVKRERFETTHCIYTHLWYFFENSSWIRKKNGHCTILRALLLGCRYSKAIGSLYLRNMVEEPSQLSISLDHSLQQVEAECERVCCFFFELDKDTAGIVLRWSYITKHQLGFKAWSSCRPGSGIPLWKWKGSLDNIP